MSAVPIEVEVTCGDRHGNLRIVADPHEGLTAANVGNAVSVFLLEHPR